MTPAEDTERPRLARGRAAVIAGRTLTVLALGIVWCALVAPNQPDLLTPGAFLRIPIEGVVLVTLSLVLPGRWARVMAVVAGGVLGVLTVVKILDIGFFATLDRPFDPVTDWGYFGPATGVVRDSVGHGWTVVVVIGAVLIGLAVLGIVPLAMLRVTRVAGRHPAGAARTVAVLATAWVLGAALGLQFQAGEPIASTASAGLAYDEVQLVRTSIDDQASFDRDLRGVDRFGSLPGSELLTGLRGKDVVVAFVESYGRVAVQDSTIAPAVDAVLRSGTASLQRHGYLSRSAFLTSPTFGGISWLAHSTLQSGLWVDNQNRYDQLVASDRFTLSDAFARAGWRTVGDVPSNSGDWPEGRTFYHYDKLYNRENVGYSGPEFSYASMPDQYILSTFDRHELAPAQRRPVMAEIDLVSSHIPWAPLPQLVPWNAIGDGSIYDPMPLAGSSPDAVWRSAAGVQAAYGQSIQYSLQSIVQFVENAHDPNLVLVVLGDHQPASIVSGSDPTHDVPISVISSDPRVLDRISSWGWQPGMLPGPDAPVWPMDSFRDRFLTAYGPAKG